MEYIFIYLIFVFSGIFFDLIRLILANILSFDVEEFSVFMGPKLFSQTFRTTKFDLKAIPYGSYVKLKDTFFEHSRFSRITIIYLPTILLYLTAFYVQFSSQNYIYIMSSKLLIIINGISLFFSVIFDRGRVF